MTDAAKALRTKLCIETECTFDDDCSCLDEIRAALAAAQAGAGVSLSSNEGLENWQRGFAAGIEAVIANGYCSNEMRARALRPAETAMEVTLNHLGRAQPMPLSVSEPAGATVTPAVARMAEAIQKSIEGGCDITPPESMVAARAAYLALLQRGKE